MQNRWAVVALAGLVLLGIGGCSSSESPADPSATPTGSEGQAFPNDDQQVQTATEQMDFVVAALTEYASPLQKVTVGPKAVTSYAQETTSPAAQYAQDQQTVIQNATSCIDEQLASSPTKPAVVMDIDETILSNAWYILQQPNLAADKTVRLAAAQQKVDPAIEASKGLFEHVMEAGAAVILISGRPDSFRGPTARNLSRVGLTGYAELILAEDNSTLSAGEYKTEAREQLRGEGWTLVGNVGDQFSDLDDASGSPEVPCSYKLPNPYYFIEW